MRCCTKRYALDLRVLTQQSVQRNAAGNAFLRMQQVGVDTQAGFNAGQRSILRRFRVKVAQKAGLHLRRKRHRHGQQRAVAGVLHQNDVRELLRKGIGVQGKLLCGDHTGVLLQQTAQVAGQALLQQSIQRRTWKASVLRRKTPQDKQSILSSMGGKIRTKQCIHGKIFHQVKKSGSKKGG